MESELRQFVRALERAVCDRVEYSGMGMRRNHAAWRVHREGG
jgi:hypothetical protein